MPRLLPLIHVHPHPPPGNRNPERIPKALLFKARGLPQGHKLLGYNDRGECPMFRDNACSIYEHRPQTCRDYDCRIFAATVIAVDRGAQAGNARPEIAQRVSEWKFRYASEKSRSEQAALRRAAVFLQKNRHLFPHGAIPTNPEALAVLAVRVFRLFMSLQAKPKAATVHAIMSELTPGESANTRLSKKVSAADSACCPKHRRASLAVPLYCVGKSPEPSSVPDHASPRES
ncbi:MAG TPA: hypothetical protein VGN17_07760 [Bryobacteraceae bacterium]